MSCDHTTPNLDLIRLTCGRASVVWCRACSDWHLFVDADPLTGDEGTEWAGNGLDDYQTAVAELARAYSAFDGAANLWNLGGHASEVEFRSGRSSP